MRSFTKLVSTVGMLGVMVALLTAAPAAAGRAQTVRCVGTGDFCGAAVSLVGGASNRVVTVNLTDTDLKLARVSVIPAASRRAFSISKASYRLGGSQYRFTLNAVRANRRGARIILIFAAGGRFGRSGVGGLRGVQSASAIFSVGSGMTVSIIGGGGGTSLCTNDETNTTFVTKGDNESHPFSFDAKSSGSCYFDLSWSQFKVRVKNPAGTLVASGTMFLGQQYVFGDYIVSCEYGPWVGATCAKTSAPLTLKITKT
jgi:hypothetical protein